MRLPSSAASRIALAVIGGLVAASAAAIPVNTELQLLVDVSGSVDDGEFALQRDAYVQAFRNPVIQAQLVADGGTAVRLVYWSGATEQSAVKGATTTGWFHIDTIAAANAYATLLASTARPFAGQTAIGSAINFAMSAANASFGNNGFEGRRFVIDVSGDGATNDGDTTSTARDAAARAGVTINGLVILGEPALDDFYRNNVVTSGGFLRAASGFSTFANAIQDKILAEVSTVPEPSTFALMGLGLGLLGFAARRRRMR